MTFEAGFDSVLPQILPGYLNKLLKVRSKMGYRHLTERRRQNWNLEKAYMQTIHIPCYQTWRGTKISVMEGPNFPDPVSAPAYTDKDTFAHRSTWTVSVQRQWRSCIIVQNYFGNYVCKENVSMSLYPCHQDAPKWILVHTQSAWYSPNIIPR